MYHAIVRRRAARMFDALSRGDWPEIVGHLTSDVHHVLPGEHPLGGERHTRDAVLAWFECLARLYPSHEFDVQNVVAGGWPWSTWVAVQWTARLRPRRGDPYMNHGAHWIRIRWGRASSFHAYLDTQRVARSCAEMAAAGIQEAAAPPIVDP